LLENKIVRVAVAFLFATTFLAMSPNALHIAGAAEVVTEQQASPEQLEFFEKSVRPLLVTHCYECHSGQSPKLQADLRLDHRDGFLVGGDSGPVIVPGDAEASMFIEAIRYQSYEMPPKGKMNDDEIDVFVRWIDDGAVWPGELAPQVAAASATFDLQQRKADHWVWQPITKIAPPVSQTDWPVNAIDHFILHDLEQVGLAPAAPVDRQALLRRLAFDLTGLPPTPSQIEAFAADQSPVALERLVDSLLQSPHFGERWGRHWLDLVRYAESRGHEFDNDAYNAFQYRDYVVRAFNEDVPYDQFLTEHIAGDQLESPRLNRESGFNESILGTGFWCLGEWVHSPVDIRKDETDRFDNMIDVMSKAFLGLTVACARCHDHKFDAISTADYYALSGFLQSSDYRQVRFDALEQNRQIAAELKRLDQRYCDRIARELASRAEHVAHGSAIENLVSSVQPSSQAKDDSQGRPDTQTAQHVLVDYRLIAPSEYIQDGYLFGPRPRQLGELHIINTSAGPQLHVARFAAAATDPFWNGLRSTGGSIVRQNDRLAELPMSGRTLRTPTVTLEDGRVACRVRGTGHVIACVDSHRLVAGPLHGETIKQIKPSEQWQWVVLSLDRYRGHRLHFEFVPAEDASLEVAVITQGASAEQLAEIERQQAAASVSAERMSQWIEELLTGDSGTADSVGDLITRWGTEREALRERVQVESRLAIAITEGTGEDDRILIRGNASNPGTVVPRRFLAAIDDDQPLPITSRSGRLELAQRINDPANPLAHRVIVNRLWHSLMGRGIVATTDDFGVLGQLPTHPQLLDHLADRFLQDGRSIKRMIRYIVLSQTYRMSGQTAMKAVQQDPMNLLWHHRPPKRIEGEAIRDSLLAVSGRLDVSMYGQPVPIHLTPFMEGRGRPSISGPVDGDGRRSIYIAVRRNFLSPFMLAFDTPTPFSTMGRRNVSNVPAQALILMNDPFVVAQSQHWAEHLCSQHCDLDPAEAARLRIVGMYQSAFARLPSESELDAAMTFLFQPTDSATADKTPVQEVSRWADLAHVLINTKEFVFLR
jgi:hypothetical protein